MTNEEIERGLTDSDWEVRWAFAERTDFTPSPAQVERGLTDVDWRVRRAFSARTDFIPTLVQIERGVLDKDKAVREVFQNRQAEWAAQLEAQELHKRYTRLRRLRFQQRMLLF